MNRLFRGLIHLTWALMLTVAVLLVWALWIEAPFITYTNLPFPVPALVKAGEVVPMTVIRCSSANATRAYTITRELRSADPAALPIVLAPVLVSITPGCAQTVSLLHVVPADTPPARYVLTGLAIAQGTMRPFSVPWHSQSFDVVAK